MAKKTSKQVPLVIYKGGERIEIGKASVSSDGEITAQVAKDVRRDIKDLLFGDLLDHISVNPKPPPSLFYNNVKVRPPT